MNSNGASFEDEAAQIVPSGVFSGGDFTPLNTGLDWSSSVFSGSSGFGRQDDGQVPFFGHTSAAPTSYRQNNSMAASFACQQVKEEPKSLLECLNFNAPVPQSFYAQQSPMISYEAQQHAIDYAIAKDKMEQVSQLALQAAMNDVQEACKALRIPSEPYMWTRQDTRAWLEWTCRQYNVLNCVDLRKFDCDGFELSIMDESEFRAKAPACGDLLWSVLDIWRTSGCMNNGIKTEVDMGGYGCQPQRCQSTSSGSEYSIASAGQEFYSFGSFGTMQQNICDRPYSTRPMSVFTGSPAASASGDSGFETEHVSEVDEATNADNDMDRSFDGTGGHTQLWQFLKEMLSKPDRFVSAIRWLDRSKGIFKIEDSVRVARCWGKRKNRPAMNYDKLSRSIRQYYKKGIMKKTERSQRLVYQFCAAYAQ